MVDFILSNLPYLIISAVGLVAAIIIFFVNLANGKSFKSSFAQLKEDINSMKYRTADYQQKEGAPAPSEFTPYRDDFFYDESTGELVKKEQPVNVQEQIESYKDVAISSILDRLLPGGEQYDDDEVVDYYDTRSVLDTMIEAYEVAEEMRERYNLPEDMNFDEVLAHVENVVDYMREKLVAKKTEEVKKTISAEEVKEVPNVQTSEKKSSETAPQA